MKMLMSLVLACGVMAGCMVQRVEEEPLVREPDYSMLMTDISNGVMSGDVGPVANINVPSQNLAIWDDGSYTSINSATMTHVDNKPRAVMMFVSSTNRDLFLPGTNVTFDNSDSLDSGIGVLGCVGQEIDVYDIYDAAAREITIQTTEGGDGAVDVIINGTWDTGADAMRHATLSFSIQR